ASRISSGKRELDLPSSVGREISGFHDLNTSQAVPPGQHRLSPLQDPIRKATKLPRVGFYKPCLVIKFKDFCRAISALRRDFHPGFVRRVIENRAALKNDLNCEGLAESTQREEGTDLYRSNAPGLELNQNRNFVFVVSAVITLNGSSCK